MSVSSWVSNSSSFLDFDFVGTIDYELPRRKEITTSSEDVFLGRLIDKLFAGSIIESHRTGKTGVQIGTHQINYYTDRKITLHDRQQLKAEVANSTI